jgi:glycosyltransferase involved in cell wall biosynthesis
MRTRLVILTEIIAPYRIPVFNALARHDGIDLHVIFLAENDPGLREWKVYRDEIRFSYQVLPSRRLTIAGHKILLNREVKKSLNDAAPDAIVCGGYNYPASWQAKSWAAKNRIPFILWVESTARDRRRRNRVIEMMKTSFMRGSSAFLVPGKSSFEYVRSYGTKEENIFTAPNAVDIDLFARRAAAAHSDSATFRQALRLPDHFFLYVGRLVEEKGVFDLLDAYGKLSAGLREQIGLVFVGDGPARTELARQSSMIAPGRVEYAGFAQRDELAGYYALSEALVFPSHSDPWGLVVNEAMACGLPVIATDAAGCTADLVENNWNGLVIRSRDVGQLAVAMEDLARYPDIRFQMGNRSRERILRYSPQACAAGIAHAALTCATKRSGSR